MDALWARTIGMPRLRPWLSGGCTSRCGGGAPRLYDANAEKATTAAKQVQHLVEFATGVCGGGGDTFVLEIKASLEASIREMLALKELDFSVDEPVVASRIDTNMVVAAFERALCSPYGIKEQVQVIRKADRGVHGSSLVPLLQSSVPVYTATARHTHTC